MSAYMAEYKSVLIYVSSSYGYLSKRIFVLLRYFF